MTTSLVNLNLRIDVNTTRDTDGNMLKGQPQFFTTPDKGWVEHLMNQQTPIPKINCSRSGDGCPTSLMELQTHNGHVPFFEDESAMNGYIARIISDITDRCNQIDVKLIAEGTEKVHTLGITESALKVEPCEGCELWFSNDDLEMLKSNDNEAVLCASCIEKAEAMGNHMIDEMKEEGNNE